LSAELIEVDTVAQGKRYIKQVPGQDASRDAFNILQAVRHDDPLMVRMIMEHQTSEWGTEDIMATMTAWLALVLRAMPAECAEHFVGHLRDISELSQEDRLSLAVQNGRGAM
jgi:hypothetical protein